MFNGKALRVLTLGFVAFSLFLLPLISGCTKHPSQDQINKLEEARMAAEAAEKELNVKEAERADLEQQVDAGQRELNELKAKRDEVRACVKTKKAE